MHNHHHHHSATNSIGMHHNNHHFQHMAIHNAHHERHHNHHHVGMGAAYAIGMPAPPPPVTTSINGVITVPLMVEKRGDVFAFPYTYTLALRDKLAEEEFRSIIDELNETARCHGPSMGGFTMCLAMCPCTAICTIFSLKSKFERMAVALESTCHTLNKHYQGRVNLQLVSSNGPTAHHAQSIRINMELLSQTSRRTAPAAAAMAMAGPLQARMDDEAWREDDGLANRPLRASTPPRRPLPDSLPPARISSLDVASLYPSMHMLHPAHEQHAAPPCSSHSVRAGALPMQPTGATHGAPSQTSTTWPVQSVHSLQALCVGVVGQHLDQYLDQLGPGALLWLPPDMKAALVAVARRRRTLTDSVLLALADPTFTSLDLWGCGPQLSDHAIRKAVCSMPRLQALDITGCVNITPTTLRRIAARCPELKLLRLGVTQVEEAAASVLADILPRVDSVADEDVEDCWETLADEGPSYGDSPPGFPAAASDRHGMLTHMHGWEEQRATGSSGRGAGQEPGLGPGSAPGGSEGQQSEEYVSSRVQRVLRVGHWAQTQLPGPGVGASGGGGEGGGGAKRPGAARRGSRGGGPTKGSQSGAKLHRGRQRKAQEPGSGQEGAHAHPSGVGAELPGHQGEGSSLGVADSCCSTSDSGWLLTPTSSLGTTASPEAGAPGAGAPGAGAPGASAAEPGVREGGGARATSAAAAAAFGQGRLASLRWLIWPGAPKAVQQAIQQQCPKVQLNPMPASLCWAVANAAAREQRQQLLQRQARARAAEAEQMLRQAMQAGGAAGYPGRPGAGMGPAAGGGARQDPAGQPTAATASARTTTAGRETESCFKGVTAGTVGGGPSEGGGAAGAEAEGGVWDPLDPMCALDQPLVSLVGPAAWEGLSSGSASATQQSGPCKSLAERFRQAYIDRARRLYLQEQRMAEALRRRRLREDRALQALTVWLDEA